MSSAKLTSDVALAEVAEEVHNIEDIAFKRMLDIILSCVEVFHSLYKKYSSPQTDPVPDSLIAALICLRNPQRNNSGIIYSIAKSFSMYKEVEKGVVKFDSQITPEFPDGLYILDKVTSVETTASSTRVFKKTTAREFQKLHGVIGCMGFTLLIDLDKPKLQIPIGYLIRKINAAMDKCGDDIHNIVSASNDRNMVYYILFKILNTTCTYVEKQSPGIKNVKDTISYTETFLNIYGESSKDTFDNVVEQLAKSSEGRMAGKAGAEGLLSVLEQYVPAEHKGLIDQLKSFLGGFGGLGPSTRTNPNAQN